MSNHLLKNHLIFSLIFAAFSLSAQNYATIRGGVYFGNVSKSKDGGAVTSRVIFGTQYGVSFAFDIDNDMAIVPEFNFIQKGLNRNISQNHNYIYRLHYFEHSALFKYKFLNNSKSRDKRKKPNAYLVAGLYFANAKTGKLINLPRDEVEDLEFDGGLHLNHFDWGIPVGFGCEIPLGSGNIILELRYHQGVAYVQDIETLPDGRLKNRGISFSLGYSIKAGK